MATCANGRRYTCGGEAMPGSPYCRYCREACASPYMVFDGEVVCYVSTREAGERYIAEVLENNPAVHQHGLPTGDWHPDALRVLPNPTFRAGV